jgi:non-specific serine/threonine protein kinase
VGGSPFDAEAWQPLFQDRIAQARQALGDAAFDAGLAEGGDATVEQLTAFALGEAPHLEKAGDRADGSSVPGPTGLRLTPRELEVAELVAECLTNRQIAHRLVLSERTVDGHVQRALTKLGFRSRTQLVTWVAQRDRPDDARNGN